MVLAGPGLAGGSWGRPVGQRRRNPSCSPPPPNRVRPAAACPLSRTGQPEIRAKKTKARRNALLNALRKGPAKAPPWPALAGYCLSVPPKGPKAERPRTPNRAEPASRRRRGTRGPCVDRLSGSAACLQATPATPATRPPALSRTSLPGRPGRCCKGASVAGVATQGLREHKEQGQGPPGSAPSGARGAQGRSRQPVTMATPGGKRRGRARADAKGLGVAGVAAGTETAGRSGR